MGDRILPPWEQIPYFQPPTTIFKSGGGPWSLVVPADPNRVLLVFAVNGAGIWQVWPDPEAGGQDTGINLVSTSPPLVINWSWWGPLVNAAWYAAGAGGSVLQILAQSLYRWPEKSQGSIND